MKYILKKEYPGSPKLGNTIDNLENDWIENYPEFWKLVVEKDYEILSVITNNNKFIEKVYNQDATIEPYWKIHSVKRLSDGEIFTIGDKVFSEYVNYTINKISIVNDKCMVSALYDINNPNGSRLHYNLNNFKKAKQPLFTTEDGVDIFEGDKIYSIDKTKLIFKDIDRIIQSQYFERSSLYKYFSTKEKAEEYILLNKPCLSYNEVLNATKIRNKNTFETLKDLVKSKIQQSV